MSDISFACPSCNQVLEGADDLIGQTVECPTCKVQFSVPRDELSDTTATAPHVGDQQVYVSDAETGHAGTVDAPSPDGAAPPAEVPPTGTSPVSTDTFGDNLGQTARAAGAEARRGGRLVALRAQIEKARRVDLKRAYHSLGEAAFAKRVQPDRYAQAYKEIADIDDQIVEKTATGTTDTTATITTKAKGVVTSAKRHAEAELLKFGRSNRFEPLGRKIFDAGDHAPELSKQIAEVRAIETRISQLEEEADRCSMDGVARASLRTSGSALLRKLTSGIRASDKLSDSNSAPNQRNQFDWQRLLPLAAYTLGLGWVLGSLLPDRAYVRTPVIPVSLLAIPSLLLAVVTSVHYIRPNSVPVRRVLGAAAFTAIAGLFLLLQFQVVVGGVDNAPFAKLLQAAARSHNPISFVYVLILKTIGWSYSSLNSEHLLTRFIAYIAGVGLCEEFTKLIPLFFLISRARRNAASLLGYREFLLTGFFSGVGFGVGEALSCYAPWNGNVWVGSNVLRWYSVIPSHAIWSTVVAAVLWAFIPAIHAAVTWHKRLLYCAAATGISALIHGVYDVICSLPYMGIAMAALALAVMHVVVCLVATKERDTTSEHIQGGSAIRWIKTFDANPMKFLKAYGVAVGLMALSLVWSSKLYIPTPNELYWGIPGATSVPVGQWACERCDGTGKVGRKSCPDCNGRGITSKPPPGTDIWDPYADKKQPASRPPPSQGDAPQPRWGEDAENTKRGWGEQ